MNVTHPTAAQLERYRRRTAPPAETLEVDAHIAACDRCFEALSADAHLTFEQLVEITEGRESGAPHLALCPMCRRELDDLQRLREVMRGPRRRRWPWMLAAAAVLAIVAGVWLLPSRDVVAERRAGFSLPPPDRLKPVLRSAPASVVQRPRILDTLITNAAVLRGRGSSDSFALHAPVATVVLDARPQLRWAAVGSSYEITILDIDAGTVAASGTSKTNSWRPNALKRNRTYAWQVAASTPEGRLVAPGRGGEARFHVAAQSGVEGDTPLERGVALANLGALDDAERELEAANATALLEQVRAWRAQRGRPTTTNGAQ
ncbi:MAG TPA: hypothetical protein VF266_11620 [Thermoanaerobaculia bacterium]